MTHPLCRQPGFTISRPDVVRYIGYTALNLSIAAVSTGLALNYIKYPQTLTQYAGGHLFQELPFTKGLMAGVIVGPFLRALQCTTFCVPCCTPLFCLWRMANRGASGRYIQDSGRCTISSVLTDVLKQAAPLLLLIAIQAMVCRSKVCPDTTSWFRGFAAGGILSATVVSAICAGC